MALFSFVRNSNMDKKEFIEGDPAVVIPWLKARMAEDEIRVWGQVSCRQPNEVLNATAPLVLTDPSISAAALVLNHQAGEEPGFLPVPVLLNEEQQLEQLPSCEGRLRELSQGVGEPTELEETDWGQVFHESSPSGRKLDDVLGDMDGVADDYMAQIPPAVLT